MPPRRDAPATRPTTSPATRGGPSKPLINALPPAPCPAPGLRQGYKYVALCVNSIAYLVGGDRPYLLTMLYTGLSSSYFMLKTAAQIVPTELENTKARREVVVLVMGLTQFVSIWVLGKAGA